VRRLSGGIGHTVAVASTAQPYADASVAGERTKSRPDQTTENRGAPAPASAALAALNT
jgi:hypothetical protein